MRKFALIVFLMVGLAGCASAPTVGNFVKNTAQANDRKVADDVVKKLSSLYPPASTRFDLQQVTPDFFGTYLVETMRAKGYAVLEFKPSSKAKAATDDAAAESIRSSIQGLPLSYVVDQAKDSNLFRVMLLINSQQSLDRVYQIAENGEIYPAGYWVRKE